MRLFKKDYDSVYFNTLAEKLPFEKKFNEHKISLIRNIKPSGNILEIGCGRGKLLKGLEKYYSVSGSDISSSAIKEAGRLLGKSRVKVLDLEKQELSGKYDLVLAFDVFEHLKNPAACLKKIKKVLKKNGILIFSVPNNYGLFGKMMTTYFNFIDRTHVSTLKRKEWVSLFEKEGFNLEIRNQHTWGISTSRISKHFSFNMVGIARPK
jgi:2-polyprenyl-3-methyl-5-hydroxy-6-metoxy-1,4-benzoquinol methylase